MIYLATEVIMPKQGLQMTEGTILQWLLSEGDKVEEGQSLFEIETDKVSIEIEAPATGTLLKIVVPEGDTVPITELVAIIGEEGENILSLLGESSTETETSSKDEQDHAKDEVRTNGDEMDYDVVIIGGGPGGYTAAIYAAKKNLKVAIVEKNLFGGTCLNRGCIPTKTLIHSATFLNDAKNSSAFGIDLSGVSVNWNAVQKNKLDVIKKLRSGVEGLMKGNKVAVYNGEAVLQDKNTISIIGENKEMIKAKSIIIATGSEPSVIPFPGYDLEGVIYSDEALDLKEIPSSMVIVGGGVIGVELAYVYNSFGTDVTILEMMPDILPREDMEIVSELKKSFKKKNIKIKGSTKLTHIERNDKDLQVYYESEEEKGSISVPKVLVAVGRKAITSALGSVDVTMDRGRIVVDEYLRTNIPNIYAIGDVTGKVMLAHVASHQGIKAVENICGETSKMDYSIVPSCIYTQPEIASVGLNEEDAKAKYGNVKVGKFPFSASGKAMTAGENTGFVKIIADEKWNEILGVHIIGPHATELIAEGALAIKLQCTVEELADTIHAHPTLSESIMEASLDVIGSAIHKL